MQRRVVITGLGVLAPNGIGKEAFWSACVAGRSGIRRITRFDASLLTSQIAGEIHDFDPEALGLIQEEYLNTDRGTQFAMVAAHLALQDAGLINTLSEQERDCTGVYMGSAMASSEEAEKQWLQLTDRGTHSPRPIKNPAGPITLLATNSPAAAIGIHHQLHGPSTVIATGCSAGADAIGQAFWAIQEKRGDRMVAGGVDSAITYAGIDVFCIMGAVSTRNDAPERASRPYDRDRDGFVMAEGAGVLLLEERELALARKAHIYAELIAFTSNSNAHHMTALPPNGEPLQALLKQALFEAQLTPAQLDYINSHGSSTPSNEGAETAAYKAVFGEHAYHIPISATKSMIGHTQGAASAIEAIVSILVLENQLIPPTINCEELDPRYGLDMVQQVVRPFSRPAILLGARGMGGANVVIALKEAS
jgi:3-oxoacyl-(acyl-carrier-protein) synthase